MRHEATATGQGQGQVETADPAPSDRLDRHGLVLAIWLPAGLVSLALFHAGFATGGPGWLAAAFLALLAGFACHVIVNAVTRTGFTAREVALALVLMLAGILAFVLSTWLVAGFAARFFLPLVLGMAALVASVIAYLVIRHGPRAAFERFDVIRDNNPRKASHLPHRGGRR